MGEFGTLPIYDLCSDMLTQEVVRRIVASCLVSDSHKIQNVMNISFDWLDMLQWQEYVLVHIYLFKRKVSSVALINHNVVCSIIDRGIWRKDNIASKDTSLSSSLKEKLFKQVSCSINFILLSKWYDMNYYFVWLVVFSPE